MLKSTNIIMIPDLQNGINIDENIFFFFLLIELLFYIYLFDLMSDIRNFMHIFLQVKKCKIWHSSER